MCILYKTMLFFKIKLKNKEVINFWIPLKPLGQSLYGIFFSDQILKMSSTNEFSRSWRRQFIRAYILELHKLK